MTAAPQSPMVARVAEAIRQVPLSISSTRRSGQNGLRNAEDVAQAALDACQAQKLLDTLCEYIAASDACTEAGGDDVAAMLRFGEADKAARALLAEFGVASAAPTQAERTDDAEASFRRRFEADKADEMTEEAWGQWVDKLPKDEFWAMMELGLRGSK